MLSASTDPQSDRHEPPYPTGSDPRPWWHRESVIVFEARLRALEGSTTHTDLALIAQRLGSLEAETRFMRRAMIAAAPLIASIAAVVSQLIA